MLQLQINMEEIRISHKQKSEDYDFSGLIKFMLSSLWPCGLRRRSAAARLLGLWVRIQPAAAWMFVVSVVCCQVEVSAMS